MGRRTSKPEWSAEDSLRATRLRDAAEAGDLTWIDDGGRHYLLHGEPDTEPERLDEADAAVVVRLIEQGHMVIVRGAHSDRGAVENLQS